MGIAPEGTTTNTSCLMTFKKGAFKDFKPCKIVCFKFSTEYFMPFYDVMPTHTVFLMLMCNWRNDVEFTEFEGVYDPKNIKGIDFNDPDAWKVYAAKVRDLMAKCLNVPKVADDFSSYKEWKEFGKIYKAEVNKLLGKKKK